MLGHLLLVLLCCARLLCNGSCHASQQDVYMVLLRDAPVVHLFEDPLPHQDTHIYLPGQLNADDYASYLVSTHDRLLHSTFRKGTYKKLYSYNHLVNGFSALLTSEQAEILQEKDDVVLVERDTKVRKQTTYTPSYLGLPSGAWQEEGGAINAGEGVVIGILDTGIDPTHPSFSDNTLKPYPNANRYKGSCEVAPEFPQGSCNKKLVGAQHFAEAAIASGQFNATIDFASPLDGDGHGTHTASTAAGNNGIEVIVDGLNFGFASGMAPRAHIAVYKALYRGFGGFISDVVAAIEQAVKDKVDILSLSIGPGGPPPGVATFFNIFDMAMLSVNKAGIFVVQAAGNAGPSPQSILSFSPWICSVAASVHDRTYPNSLVLGNNETVEGVGLATGTPGNDMHRLILASDALKKGSSTTTEANDCQDSSLFEEDMVQGKVIICSYDIDYIFGGSSVKNVIGTIKNLSAVGVVMVATVVLEGDITMPTIPFPVPAIIIPTMNGTKTVLDYYNAASNGSASVRIHGSKAKFSQEAPKVAKFSSRGPDPGTDKYQAADVLKPNVMAPGSMIWAGWSSVGVDSSAFQGEQFAMISGTSMATPHIAGIAALIKQKNPTLSPAALASALATTAYTVDEHGNPLLAQNPSNNTSIKLGPATHFDFGNGAVNATTAIDPGLVFDAGFEDYVKFLCTISGADEVVKNFTGVACTGASSSTAGLATDLNLPSITIANLTSSRIVPRTVMSIATASETYKVTIAEPKGVSIAVKPMEWTINPNSTQELLISITATQTDAKPSFGHFLLTGNRGHKALVPISIVTKSITTLREGEHFSM